MLGSTFPSDLSALPADQLHRAGADATRTEAGLSYLRRLVQGRSDIVAAECTRRESGAPAGDLPDLIARLPAILAEHPPVTGRSRSDPPRFVADVQPALVERLEALVSPDQLGDLPGLAAEDLVAIRDGLAALEREVSHERRELQHLIDRIHEEIGRRYRTGGMSADDAVRAGLFGRSAASKEPGRPTEPTQGQPGEQGPAGGADPARTPQ